MFAMGSSGRNILSSAFGKYDRTLRSALSNGLVGGLNSLYQIGGPRSVQLSLRLSF